MARQKAIRDHYYINVEGQMMEVSQDIYYVWYGGARQERYQEERNKHFGVTTFSSLSNEENDILEVLPAVEHTEHEVERKELYQELYAAMKSLPEKEKRLIYDIYFKEISKT